jgi:hypothetical protein
MNIPQIWFQSNNVCQISFLDNFYTW